MSVSATALDQINCNSRRGCPAFFQAGPIGCCFSAETRRQAQAEGWVTGLQQAYSSSTRHLPRLDYCPDHAAEAES